MTIAGVASEASPTRSATRRMRRSTGPSSQIPAKGTCTFAATSRDRVALGRLLKGGVEDDDPAGLKSDYRKLVQPRIHLCRNFWTIAFEGKPCCLGNAEETFPLDVTTQVKRSGSGADFWCQFRGE